MRVELRDRNEERKTERKLEGKRRGYVFFCSILLFCYFGGRGREKKRTDGEFGGGSPSLEKWIDDDDGIERSAYIEAGESSMLSCFGFCSRGD